MITEISTRDMSRAEWEKARMGSVGGSDAAAIVGLSEYATPYSLWAEKTGRVIPEDISQKEAVRLGNDLEDYVAHRFMEATGKKVVRKNAILKNDLYPWAHANVDRLVVGEDAGLEIKTTSALNLRKFKGKEFPEKYYSQCVHYLAVTGRKKWYLAVLVLGVEFKIYELERDEDEIAALMDMERDFWEHVKDGTPPGVIGLSADSETIQALYPESNGESIALFGRDAELAHREMLKEQIKTLEQQVAVIDQRIQQDMGAAEVAREGMWRVTWKSCVRSTFDRKRFEADHPGLIDAYMKTSNSRRFEVRKERA